MRNFSLSFRSGDAIVGRNTVSAMPESTMKLRLWLAVAGLLLVTLLGYPAATRVIPGLANRVSGTGPAAGANGAAGAARMPVKTRSGKRPPAPPAPTHGAHQWREFYLPPVEIAGQCQIGDAATQFITQLHPDGSRTILAVTPTRIDATGRPVREQR